MSTPPNKALQSRLSDGEVIVMDGGTGSEARRRGLPTGPVTWSADALVASPDVIREIHEDYLRAGAEVIVTNTFATGRPVLEMGGLADRTEDLNRLAVTLAQEARDKVSGRDAVVAGGVAAVTPSFDPVVSDFREQTELLAEAGVDVIVLEMMTRVVDVEMAVAAAVSTGLPVWAGLSCHVADGELHLGVRKRPQGKVSEAVNAAVANGASVVFVMHTPAEDTEVALREARRSSSLLVGAYANVDSRNPTKPSDYLLFAQRWVEAGAQIVGGCCGTTPEHVRALKQGLPARMTVR